MLANRYYEIIMTNEQFRLLVNHIDLRTYESCMYTTITPDECDWYAYEDEEVEILHRMMMRENDLLELIDDMRSVVNIITDEEGYGAAEELEDLLEDIVYEMRNEYY